MAPVAAEERSEAAIVIFGFNCYAANILWERACPRWQHIVPPDTARCLQVGKPGSYRENMSAANPASRQVRRPFRARSQPRCNRQRL